ncbi:putative activation/secretion signal peptide protein [Burkholderiales bacterium 8X]|nr:putative activation/secretion signal peptide protein [Burkholderiales bacterium 8X]
MKSAGSTIARRRDAARGRLALPPVLCALALAGWQPSAPAQSSSGNPVTATTPPSQGLAAAPVPAASAASFRLEDLRLNGAQALGDEELKSTTQPYLGRNVTLADLEALARDITARYRARGYFLAQAVVPVQTVRGGVVEISIVEGRLGKLDVLVAADAPISEQRVRGFLAGVPTGEALHAHSYERAMLLLSDQPGIRVSSGLQEGTVPGTTDLTVEVTPADKRWSFTAEADNHGTAESGRYRVGGTVRWLSPFGIGDNLDARVLVSNDNGLTFGRLSYEAPIGTSGLRGGIGIGRIGYELGGEFADLGAKGSADVLDVSLNYPLIRQRQHNLFLRLGADSKRLTDEFQAVEFTTRKKVRGLGIGYAWERRDDVWGGGYWASAGTLYHGKLDIEDPQSASFDRGPAGHRTEGGFNKLSLQVSRLQSLLPRHALYVAFGGQLASKNLDPSEKLALGGARAVRAYSSGEMLVDQGWVGNVEWRWSASDELTPFVFYDAARGKITRDPTPFDTANSHSLRGMGIGLSWTRPGNFAINATLAWRDGTRPAQTDGGGRNPRLYVQAQKNF